MFLKEKIYMSKYISFYLGKEIFIKSLKSGFSPSKKVCFIFFNQSPLKLMKNAFFHLKSSFRSQDI